MEQETITAISNIIHAVFICISCVILLYSHHRLLRMWNEMQKELHTLIGLRYREKRNGSESTNEGIVLYGKSIDSEKEDSSR
jgi:hypothetical protein